MAEFLYDATVYADDLNNIAVDLGGALIKKFTNDYPYAVGSLNAITGDLVSSGITSYGDKFSVTVDGENIVIGTGLAIFEGGLKYKLTSSLTLPLAAGELFIELNKELNTVAMKIGTLPAMEKYVHIATIDVDGTVTDKRVFAKAKVNFPAYPLSYDMHYEGLTTTKDNPWKKEFSIAGVTEVFVFYYTSSGGAAIYKFNIEKQGFTGTFCQTNLFYTDVDEAILYAGLGLGENKISLYGTVSGDTVTFEIRPIDPTGYIAYINFYFHGGTII